MLSFLASRAGVPAAQEVERYPVEVGVVDAVGSAVAGAVIVLDGGTIVPTVRSVADADGRVEVSLIYGTYDVHVESRHYPSLFAGPVRVGPEGADPSSLELRLRAGVRLTGKVRFRDGTPIEGARVWLPSYRSRYGAHVLGERETTTDADGRYVLEGMPARPWLRLEVEHPSIPRLADEVRDWRRSVAIPARYEGGTFALHDIVIGDRAGTLVLHVTSAAPGRVSVVFDYEDPEPSSDIVNSWPVAENPARFERLRAGRWRALLRGPKGPAGDISFEIRPGGVTEQRIELPVADETLVVQVVDPEGRPVEGIDVSLETSAFNRIGREASDATGRVRFAGLAPGEARLEAQWTRRAAGSVVRSRGGSRYQDERLQAAGAVVVGDTDGVRLVAEAHPGDERYAIVGRVVDPDGRPMSDTRVTLRDVRSTPIEAADTFADDTTDADGRFELDGAAEGIHIVSARARGFVPAEQRVELLGAAPDSEVVLSLVPAGAVPPRRRVEPGRHSAWRVQGTSARGGGVPRLRYVSLWDPACESRITYTSAHADGSFELEGVPEGAVCVKAEWSDGTETRHAVRMAEEVRLHLEPAATGRNVVTGRVVGEGEWASAVTLSPESEDSYGRASLDAEGRFEIAGMQDGRYRLRVGMPWMGWTLAERMIEVPTSAPIEISVSSTRVEGRVLDETGDPVAARVSLLPADRGPAIFEGCCHVRTPDGVFEFERVPAGAWEVVARPADGREGSEARTEMVIEGGEVVVARTLTLRRRTPTISVGMRSGGAPRTTIHLTAKDAAGNEHAGRLDEERPRDGLELPPGRYDLRAHNAYGYEHVVPIVAPGPDVLLPVPEPLGRLVVLLPALYDTRVGLRLEVEQAGRVRDVTAAVEPRRADELGVVRSVPIEEGPVKARVIADDGRSWSVEARVIAFERVVVTAR